MFKRQEGDNPTADPPVSSIPVPRNYPAENRRDGATIGPSISIKGDLTGEEDLVIQGRVEGKVDLKQNNVTIGKNGRVKADIYGKLVTVEGQVEGNLFGHEQIIVCGTGNVRGNISAPRISIEDGAKFKGSIDMDVNAAEQKRLDTPVASKSPANVSTATYQAPKGGLSVRAEAPASRVG